MILTKKTNDVGFRPAVSPEARESQLISLAVDLVEKRLREGTATSSEIVHFLRLGSAKEKLEREILEKQKDLITAKTDGLNSQKRSDERYEEVIDAMRRYSGADEEEC